MTFFRIIGMPIEYLLGESRGEVADIRRRPDNFPFHPRFANRSPDSPPRSAPVDSLGVGTIGFVAAMDLLRQTTLVGYLRYTILASPAVYALIASFDWPRRTFIRDAIAISTIGLLAIVAIQRNIDGVPPKEDWQTLARDSTLPPPPMTFSVFYNDDPWTSPGTWYMNFKYFTPDSHRPWLILNTSATPTSCRQLRSHPILWLIGRYPQLQGPSLLPGWLPAATEEQTTAGAFCPMVPTVYPIAATGFAIKFLAGP